MEKSSNTEIAIFIVGVLGVIGIFITITIMAFYTSWVHAALAICIDMLVFSVTTISIISRIKENRKKEEALLGLVKRMREVGKNMGQEKSGNG